MTSKKQFKRPRMQVNRRFLLRRVLQSWPWLAFFGVAIGAILLLPGGFGRARLQANAERSYFYVSAATAGDVAELRVALGDYVEEGQVIGRLQDVTAQDGADEQYELRSRVSGVVAGVLHQVGDPIEAGEAVVRIGQSSTRRVTAFVPPHEQINLCVGKRCCVVTESGNKVYQGKILSVPLDSPSGDSADVGTPPRDQRILIELIDGELLPGEAVAVVADLSVLNQWFGL